MSETMKRAIESGEGKSGQPRHPLAAGLTKGWMDGMLHWMELTGRIDGTVTARGGHVRCALRSPKPKLRT